MRDKDGKLLMQFLGELNKEELLEMYLNIFNTSDYENRLQIFGAFFQEQILKELKKNENEFEISLKKFYTNSLRGKYIDYKWGEDGRYDKITPITEQWYDEMTNWLNAVCEILLGGKERLAYNCLVLLMELIDKIEDEIIIVPHDTYGEENIYSKYDYHEIYQSLKSKYGK